MRLFKNGVALAPLALLTFASSSQAFDPETCFWGGYRSYYNETNDMRIHEGSMPSGSKFRVAFENAIDDWNKNPSEFRFTTSIDDGSVSTGNSQSEVWITNDNINAPAVAYSVYAWFSCDTIATDVVMNGPYADWSATTTKGELAAYRGDKTKASATVMFNHELGHVLQLDHTNNTYSIMGDSWNFFDTHWTTASSSIGGDASAGARYLYGDHADPIEDVSVTHWRQIGVSGEYSTHGRTRILDASTNVELPQYNNGDAELAYEVSPGDTVLVEFTYENKGKNGHYVDSTFYLSTNDYISTGDRELGTSVYYTAAGWVTTTLTTLTIPSNLQLDRDYSIGVMIDNGAFIAEVDETNNRSYINIRTK